MSQLQWYAQVGQHLEQEGRYEIEARRIEDANAILQEISERKDEEFRAELESKYPMLRAWPGKATK
jgi:hypothetical protein